jgi:HrpA-like RNA helicase
MCAGPCTEALKVGELECPCPCRQGIFQMSLQERKGQSLLPRNSTIREANEELEAIIPPPTRCLRKETVLKVVDVLASENVVLVRGTPASGKTTLFEYTLLND